MWSKWRQVWIVGEVRSWRPTGRHDRTIRGWSVIWQKRQNDFSVPGMRFRVFLEKQRFAAYPRTTPGKRDFVPWQEFRREAPAVQQMWAPVFPSPVLTCTPTGPRECGAEWRCALWVVTVQPVRPEDEQRAPAAHSYVAPRRSATSPVHVVRQVVFRRLAT